MDGSDARGVPSERAAAGLRPPRKGATSARPIALFDAAPTEDQDEVFYLDTDLVTAQTREIVSTQIGYDVPAIKLGDAIYTTGPDPDATEVGTLPPRVPGVLHRIAIADGTVTTPPTPSNTIGFEILGTDGTDFFVRGKPVDDVLYFEESGFYRLPVAGGTPELLVFAFSVFEMSLAHVWTGTRNVLRVPDYAESDGVYTLDQPGQTPRFQFCITQQSGPMAASDDYVWLAPRDEDDLQRLVRIPID